MLALPRAERALLLGTWLTALYTLRAIRKPDASPPMTRQWAEEMTRRASTIINITEHHGDRLVLDAHAPIVVFGNHPCTVGTWHLVNYLYTFVADEIIFVMRNNQKGLMRIAVNHSNFSLPIPMDDGEKALECITDAIQERRGERVAFVIFPAGARRTEKRAEDQLTYLHQHHARKDFRWMRETLRWRWRGIHRIISSVGACSQSTQVLELLSTFNRPLVGTTGIFQGPELIRHHQDAQWHHKVVQHTLGNIPTEERQFKRWLEKRERSANDWLYWKRHRC